VPLNFSKYDLRDYLYHAYDIKTFSIRSRIKLMPVRDAEDIPNHLFRETIEKYMTVEMEKPFVWPEKPEDWSPWGTEEKKRTTERSVQNNYLFAARFRREEAKMRRTQVMGLLERVKKGAKEDAEVEAETTKTPLEVWQEKRPSSMLGRWH
jgi:large subunit ribosomal protein L23